MRATLRTGTNLDNYPSANGLRLDAETVPLVDEVFVVKASFGEPCKSLYKARRNFFGPEIYAK